MATKLPSHLLRLSSGLHPLKDSAFVVFEGESFRETSLTSSAVVKCDGHRPAKVTIYATQCRHFLSFFLLFRARKESWDM